MPVSQSLLLTFLWLQFLFSCSCPHLWYFWCPVWCNIVDILLYLKETCEWSSSFVRAWIFWSHCLVGKLTKSSHISVSRVFYLYWIFNRKQKHFLSQFDLHSQGLFKFIQECLKWARSCSTLHCTQSIDLERNNFLIIWIRE